MPSAAPRFRAGLIGCGNIASRYDERPAGGRHRFTHAGMYSAAERFALVGAADPAAERLAACGAFWNISALFASPVDMVRACEPDVVSIATPDDTHASVTLSLLDAPRPPRVVFLEKPLATDSATGLRVLRACRDAGVVPVVNYVRRWDENHVRACDFLAGGGLGAILSVTGAYVRGIRHNGCHLVHMLKRLFGPVAGVVAQGGAGRGSFPGDPSLDVELRFAAGPVARLTALDPTGYNYSIYEIDIFGERGRLRFVDNGRRIELHTAMADPDFPDFRRLVPVNEPWCGSTYDEAMLRAGDHLLAILDGGVPDPERAARDALDDLIVIEAALASAENGGVLVHPAPTDIQAVR